MPPLALVHVSVEDGSALGILETELAEEELGQTRVLLGEGTRVPGLDLVATEHDGCRIARTRATGADHSRCGHGLAVLVDVRARGLGREG